MIKNNQITRTADSTVFERTTGERALTIADMLTEESDLELELESLKTDEAQFLCKVAKATAGMMADYKMEQQVRSRDNAYTRDTNEHQKKTYTQEFTKGQFLSLKGKKVEVIDLQGFDGISHVIAIIKEEGANDVKMVRCQDLTERCYGRPQWSPIRQINLAVGDFVAFMGPDGEDDMRGGVITEVGDTDAVVHEIMANDKRSRWLKVWFKPGCKYQAKRECPNGYEPNLLTITATDMVLKGKITGETLSDDTKRRARAKGMTWILPISAKELLAEQEDDQQG
jgi:hypothetical protein